MSSIIRSFLLTQPIQPHTVTRYIDDIFIIWTDTTETLTSFLNDLNHFRPSLTFTHEHSTASINFLDLTILGSRLQFPHHKHPRNKNISKTLPIPAHQDQVYKSIIRGECIRYIRTNSTKETHCATLFLFKQRLLKRGYPSIFIDKVLHTINYKNRQRYLLRHQKHQQTCIPPLFNAFHNTNYSNRLSFTTMHSLTSSHLVHHSTPPNTTKPISQSEIQAHRLTAN